MASVTADSAERNTTAMALATSRRLLRHSHPAAKRPTRQTNWPTVVSACSWFDELNAGHSTRAIANSETAATTAAVTAAASMAAADRPAVDSTSKSAA